MTDAVLELLPTLRLRSLLPYLYQICSRLSSRARTKLQQCVRVLLRSLADQYPSIALYPIFQIRRGSEVHSAGLCLSGIAFGLT